jgi:hypothetical protein
LIPVDAPECRHCHAPRCGNAESLHEAFRAVVTAAGELGGARKGFWMPRGTMLTLDLERRLVASARALDKSLHQWAETAPGDARALPLHVDRALKPIGRCFRRWMEQWGWRHYLGPDGEKHIAAAIDRHHREKEAPYLQAMLSWRSAEDLAPNEFADGEAERAERLGFTPTMPPEEAGKIVWPLQKRWLLDPALFETLPETTEEDLRAFDEAVWDLHAYALQLQRVEPTEGLPTAQPGARAAPADAPEPSPPCPPARAPAAPSESEVPAGAIQGAVAPPPNPLTLDDRAVSLLTRWIKEGRRKISKRALARALGCHHSSLAGCPTFLKVWELNRSEVKSGYRDARTGWIETPDAD